MEKKFTKFEIATIKRTAQNVNPLVTKKNKIKAKIEELSAELKSLETQQESWEAAIKEMTGGFTTEDLVEKVVISDGTKDKNGNEIKVTKYVLKYPETIVPVIPTDVEWVNEEETPDEKPNAEVSEDEEYNPFEGLNEDEVPPYAGEETVEEA
jgi:predicted transcriptional regulator